MTSIFITAIFISSCNEASKKDMTNAKENLKEAKQDVKEAVISANDTAKLNAIANWQSFKNESDFAIANMEKNVATLKTKTNKAGNAVNVSLKIEVDKTNKILQDLKDKLKKRNTEFNNDLNRFDATVVAKNQSFQREFKHDMDGLGKDFKNLFKDNTK